MRRPWDRSGAGAFQGQREALVAPAAGGCQEMELEVCVEKEKKIFQKPSEESENEEMFNSIKY